MWLDRFRLSPEHSKTVELPTSYQPRSTRFQLEVPVSFAVDDQKYLGQCINVSETGLLARFKDLPELWTDGRLFLESGEHYLSINARVARIQGNDVGFAFAILGSNDQETIKVLITSVSDHPMPD